MRQSPTRLHRVRPGMAAGVILSIVAAIVIGCGGGGDGPGITSATNATATATATASTATATASTATATASTATATASTATATATTATAGTAGQLPQDVVIYTEANGENTEIRYINPNGSGDTLYATLGIGFSGFGVDPTRQNVKLFGFRDGDAPVGLYRNTTLSMTGATQVVAPTYTYIDQIQVSPDGNTVYFVAGIGDADPQLFQVPFNGGNPTPIDNAETFHLNQAGTQIVYSKLVGGDAEIFVRNVGSSGAGTQLTNNTSEDTLPQWNKQGTRIVFASDRSAGRFDLYTMSPTGSDVQTVTATDDQDERGGSFNQAGDTIAYSVLGGETGAGLYRVPAAGGTRAPIKLTEAILDSVYWTTPTGRNGRGSYNGVAKRRREPSGQGR